MRIDVRRHRRFVVFAATAAVLLFSLFLFQKTAPVIGLMNSARVVVYGIGNGLGTVIERIFSNKAALYEDNDRLRAEVSALAEEAASADQLKAENAALKELIGFTEREGIHPIPASILSRSSDLAGQVVVLNRGSADGAVIGDPIVAENGMYVGSIIRVHPYTSVARLVSDSESKIGVRILNDERTIGIAEGQDGVLLKIDFIPQSVTLNAHDLIVTSGLDPGTPSGLVVGVVTHVVSDEHNPFEQAFVEPLIDLRQLTVVGILHIEAL